MGNNERIFWEELLSSASRLQKILPEAVLVGGTAVALYAGHRLSSDADHVLPDLRERFNDVLNELESAAGWETNRIKTPVLILGKLEGVDTGIRQLIRKAPLETEILRFGEIQIVVPTMEEILRIKGLLILKRNATRDYLDFAALADSLGAEKVCHAFGRFDELYPQKNGESPLMQLQIQLAKPLPYDLDNTDLSNYKNLLPRWQHWHLVKSVCIKTAQILAQELEKPFFEE
ncbi:MAG: nucleotidyl transferase AbiEii/AbiGii toxin family protein [Synergistaceae bacterium]|jgi:hypothetical protein|nr:nucleotidyl transferase AbiEii/AbiGii toxin family protein [Synergistaceae bacterium]